MTDIIRLNDKIRNSGLKLVFLAKKAKITPPSLYRRLRGEASFDVDEAEVIGRLLGLSHTEMLDIFFARDVDKNSTENPVKASDTRGLTVNKRV